jgi:hypothetical protein
MSKSQPSIALSAGRRILSNSDIDRSAGAPNQLAE